MTGIARFELVALDCPDPLALAGFYAAITGWSVDDDGDDDDDVPEWVTLASPVGVTIAFQRVEELRAPEWPGSEHPQQLHLDFRVPDLDEGEAAVLAIGARKAEFQPGETFRVYLDPV